MEMILKKLQDAVYEGDEIESENLAREALSGNIAPQVVVDEGLRPALARLGDEFEKGEIALPELVFAGDAAVKVTKIIEKALSAGEKLNIKGIFAIGTIQGDIHAIGKDLVSAMMRAAGFQVIDLGVDVSLDEFMAVIDKVDAVGISSFISLSISHVEETVKQLKNRNKNLKVIIGGAAVTPNLAEKWGVLFGIDAFSAARIIDEALKNGG